MSRRGATPTLAILGLAILLASGPRAGADSDRAADVPRRAYWPTREWREQEPEREGFAPQGFARLDRHVKTALPHVRSVLVARAGSIVFERYYQGTDRESLHDVASVTKSVTSMLVGIALKRGALGSVDAPVGSLVADCAQPRLDRVTLRYLLTMQSGFMRPNQPPTMGTQAACARSLTTRPGSVFAYDTPASQLVMAAVATATRTDGLSFAKEHLFQPLGIQAVDWSTGADGRPFGGFGLSRRTRDLAKLAYLYLNEGRWEDREVVPANWVRESTRAHSTGGPPENEAYGFQWWVTRHGPHSAFFAGGFGGQFIYVIPGLDLLVIITSNQDRPHIENRSLVGQFVLPAMRHSPAAPGRRGRARSRHGRT